MALTDKQQAFVEAYLGEARFNATKAARRAGYPERSAYNAGWQNVRKCEIRAAIEERLEAEAMAANEVLARLAEQARADIADFFDITEHGPKLNLERAAAAGKTYLIAGLSFNQHGPVLKLHDAQAALITIGKHLGLFVEQIDLTTDGKRISKLSNSELLARAAAHLAGANGTLRDPA